MMHFKNAAQIIEYDKLINDQLPNWTTMHVMLSQPMPPDEATSLAIIVSNMFSTAIDNI